MLPTHLMASIDETTLKQLEEAYYSRSRTNWFRVEDKEKLQSLAAKLPQATLQYDEVKNCYAFVANKPINAYFDVDKDEQVEIFEEVQHVLPEKEIFVLMEIGHEGTDYLEGYVTLVTKSEIRKLSMMDWAVEQAKAMTGKTFDM